MSNSKNYYDIIGLPRDCTQEEIKERFRFLAQAFHPDKFSTAKQKLNAEQEFKTINEAYQVLSNPAERASYDREQSLLEQAEKLKSQQVDRPREASWQYDVNRKRREEEEKKEREQRKEERLKREQQETQEKRLREEERRKLLEKEAKSRKIRNIVIAILCGSCLLYYLIANYWPRSPVSSVTAPVSSYQQSYAVYSGSNANNPVVGFVYANSEIILIGRSGDTWVAFMQDGTQCWIQDFFLEVHGPAYRLPEIK